MSCVARVTNQSNIEASKCFVPCFSADCVFGTWQRLDIPSVLKNVLQLLKTDFRLSSETCWKTQERVASLQYVTAQKLGLCAPINPFLSLVVPSSSSF